MSAVHVQAAGGDSDAAEGLKAWLASRDLAKLQEEVHAAGGVLRPVINGSKRQLELRKHFAWSAVEFAG